MNDGRWLALGAVGALVVAGASRGRGSFARLSRLQQALLRLKNQIKDPEATVRAFDLIISVLPDYPNTEMNGTPPGVWDETDSLLEALRTFTGNPNATMADYRDLLVVGVRNNTYLEPFGATIDLTEDWTFTKNIGWLGREVTRSVRDKQKGEIGHDQLAVNLNEIKDQLSYVFDWAYATRPNLFQFTFTDALQASTEWHQAERQQASKAKIQRLRKQGKWADCVDGIAKLRGTVVFTFDNGWTIQQLHTRRQLLEEGNTSRGRGCLRHCIGEGDYYAAQVQSGQIQVYSLRSPNNSPFVTITVRGTSGGGPSRGRVIQAKGLLNRDPGAVRAGSGQEVTLMRRLGGEYPTIDAYLDAECLMISGFLRSENFAWETDGRSCEARMARMRTEQQGRQLARQTARQLGGQNRRRGR